MKSLDIYLSSLPEEKANRIQDQIQAYDYVNSELLSFDIYLQNFHLNDNEISRNHDIEVIKEMSKKYNWTNDFESIFSNNAFEALVVTDLSRKILWVNSGFTKMTGYSKTFAINKTPSFLQGEKTSNITRNRIRRKLQQNNPFKEIIINHKKDKSTYKCEVSIFPLKSHKTTHFLALEKIAL